MGPLETGCVKGGVGGRGEEREGERECTHCKGTLLHPYPKGTDETLYCGIGDCTHRGTEITKVIKKLEGDTQRKRSVHHHCMY